MNFIINANLVDYSSENGWRDVEKFNNKQVVVDSYRIIKKERTLVGREYWIKCIKEIFAFLTCGLLYPCPTRYFSNRVVVKIGIPMPKIPQPDMDHSSSLIKETEDQKDTSQPLAAIPDASQPSIATLSITTSVETNAEPSAATSVETKAEPIDHQVLIGQFGTLQRLTGSQKNEYLDLRQFGKFHRFGNVYCASQTAIRLGGMSPDDFLHANQININDCYSIATQYPYLEEGIDWFWEMALQKGSIIVDLTNDGDRSDRSVVPYFPEQSSSSSSSSSSSDAGSTFVCHNGITIGNTTSTPVGELKDVSLHTYQVKRGEDSAAQEVTRLHVKCWPDHQGAGIDELIQILKLLRQFQADADKCPIIHCRAGVGRTGTLTALLVASELILAGTISHANLLDELTRIVLEGRKQRNGLFVQTSEQFVVLARVCEKILADPSQIC